MAIFNEEYIQEFLFNKKNKNVNTKQYHHLNKNEIYRIVAIAKKEIGKFTKLKKATQWLNLNKSRYDEEVYHNCDLDVMLHELLVNRIILRPLYFCVIAGTDTNGGGNSSKTRKDQIECAYAMKKRWGKYFDYNFKNNKPSIRVNR